MPKNDVHGPLDVVPTCFNNLISGSGSFTNTLAVEVLPVPPLVELTVTELALRPIVVPCTSSEIVQDAPAAKLVPLKLTVEVPAVAVAVPPQSLDKLFGSATIRPAGRESVKLTPVSVVVVLGLLIDLVRLVVLFVRIEFEPKDFAITGGATTVSEAMPYPLAVVLGPVSSDVMFPLMFSYCPAVSPSTATDIVQDALADRVAPLKLMVEVPSVAVVVPPVRDPNEQDVDKPLGVLITSPLGRVSEKPTRVKSLELGLSMLKVKVLVLPSAIDVGEKTLESVGASGRGQPVKTILSNATDALGLFSGAPSTLILKVVVLTPVDGAE